MQLASGCIPPDYLQLLDDDLRCTMDDALRERDECTAAKAIGLILRLPLDVSLFVMGESEANIGYLRSILEHCQRVLLELILAEDTQSDAWRTFTLAQENGLAFLPALAYNLRSTHSNRLLSADDRFDFDTIATMKLAGQAKAVGRFCAQADAVTPFSFEQASRTLDPQVLPLIFAWAMQSYCCSPPIPLQPSVAVNTQRMAQELADFLESPSVHIPIPCHPRFIYSLFRLNYVCSSTRDISEQVHRQTLRPLVESISQSRALPPRIKPSTKPYRIGIATRYWYDSHPVHRCMSPMVHHLAERDCHLYFYFTECTPAYELDRSMGQSPHCIREYPWQPACWLDGVRQVYERALQDQLDLMFYPEIGMSTVTTLLAGLRVAPVQATGYGHPVSSFSSEIDYFIGSSWIEDEASAREYTERLLLIPGLGVCSTEPPPAPPRQRPLDAQPVRLINLSTHVKLNAELIATWKAIIERSRVPVELHLYPSLREGAAAALQAQLEQEFPAGRVFVHAKLDRNTLMRELVDGDVYLDSFPFGGFNTLVEIFSVGLPAVCPWGLRAPARFGAACIRALELPGWLVGQGRESYIQAALRAIENPGERLALRSILTRDRVLNRLCRGGEAESFARAVARAIALGPPRPGDSAPISID